MQKKNKKKAGDEKNLSPNISTVRALEKIIETDLRSYSVGLPFSFFLPFEVSGHVTTLLMTHWMGPESKAE